MLMSSAKLAELLSRERDRILTRVIEFVKKEEPRPYARSPAIVWERAMDMVMSLVMDRCQNEGREDWQPDLSEASKRFAVLLGDHAGRGVGLKQLMVIFKYFRRAIVESVAEAVGQQRLDPGMELRIHAVFDDLDVAIVNTWENLDRDHVERRLKEHYQRVNEQRARLWTMFQNVPYPIISLNLNGRVDMMNQAAMELSSAKGQTRFSDDGKSLRSEEEALEDWLRPTIAELRAVPTSTLVREKEWIGGGTRRLMQITLNRIMDPLGNERGTMVVLEDITSDRHQQDIVVASERRMRELFMALDDAILVARASKRIIYFSPGSDDRLGLTDRTVIHRHIWDVLPGLGRNETAEIFDNARKSRTSANVFTFHTPNGKEALMEATAYFGEWEGEEAYFLVLRDISEKKKAEDQIISGQRNIQALFDSIDDFLFVMDYDGRIIRTNRQMQRRLGYAADGLEGRNFLELLPATEQEAGALELERIADGSSTLNLLPLVARNGSIFRMETRTALGRWDNHRVIIALSRDISDRLRTQEILEAESDLSFAMGGRIDTFDALRLSLDAALQVTGMECGAVFILEGISGEAQITFSKGFSDDYIRNIAHVEPRSIRNDIIREGNPVYRGLDEPKMPLLAEQVVEGLIIHALVPVDLAGGSMACIEVATRGTAVFGQREREALEFIGMQLSNALNSLRVEKELTDSENRYRSLFQRMIDGFAYCELMRDREGVIVDMRFIVVNESMERVLGIDRYTMEGRRGVDINPFIQELDLMMEGVRRAFARREEVRVELSIAGGARWALASIAPLRSDDFMIMLHDITDRKKNEELERSRLLSILDAGLNMILTFDPDTMEMDYANNGAVRAMLSNKADITNMRFSDFMLEPGEDSLRISLAALDSGKEKVVVEGTFRRHDGSTFPVEMHLQEARGAARSIVLAEVLDITDRRKEEERLRQAQKMEAIGRLAGGISHDFNNLLTAVIGYNELILRSAPDGSLEKGYSLAIKNASERAANLIQQILTFSRSREGRLESTDVNDVTRNLMQMMPPLMGEDVRIVTDLNPGLPTLTTDRVHLEQVIMNLVVNARDAMPNGGTITISTYLEKLRGWNCRICGCNDINGEFVAIAVQDEGVGISQEVMDRMFEPFYTTKEKGNGLGLSTVYGIVRRMGGHLKVDSQEGVGSKFTVMIPVSNTPPMSMEIIIPEGIVENTARSAGGEVIALVEDEAAIRELLVAVLEDSGYQVISAATAEDMLEIIRDHDRLDLLLSDVVLPGMRGTDMADELRMEGRRFKCVFMSGYSEERVSDADLQAGKYDFISKPFSLGDLTRKIREVLDAAPPA
jgi:PAS domain S-box-containing protein